MGREGVVAFTDAKLDFAPREQIFYGEFNGGRRKRVLVKIIGDNGLFYKCSSIRIFVIIMLHNVIEEIGC